ncbi:MAG TPA: succinate dehydrogenase assembly factor 2 [Acidiferrobacterales bacterium]|nr:succinate dehydrogenase assembly factor 2 [Acidiferrobacterales bacterium]
MSFDDNPGQKFNRLRWQCRRGQLELDLILNDFLERHYAALSEAEQNAFARLLQLPDPTLLQWLTRGSADAGTEPDKQEISDPELRDLVSKLR